MSAIDHALFSFLKKHGSGGEKLSIALSGGADSLLLADSLCRLRAESDFPWQIQAFHVHHGLSPKADQWLQHCENFCDQKSLPFFFKKVDVARDKPQGLESSARTARYDALFALCDETNSFSLLLAQHQNDQAETLLHRLLRGTGTDGAAAMREEKYIGKIRLLRPFLSINKNAMLSAARARGLEWIEDESNTDCHYTRNFLRHQVLPVLEQRFPAAVEKLTKASTHFAESAELLNILAAEDWARASLADGASWAALREMPMSRLKNLLRYRLKMLSWSMPDRPRLEEFARQIKESSPETHPQLDLPEGMMLANRGVVRWLSSKHGSA